MTELLRSELHSVIAPTCEPFTLSAEQGIMHFREPRLCAELGPFMACASEDTITASHWTWTGLALCNDE